MLRKLEALCNMPPNELSGKILHSQSLESFLHHDHPYRQPITLATPDLFGDIWISTAGYNGRFSLRYVVDTFGPICFLSTLE